MYNIMIFLHVTGALLLGIYLVFPFLAGRLATLSGPALEGLVSLLLGFVRIGHYALILLLLTGGVMIRDAMPSVLWVTAAVILLLIIGAMIGMIQKRLKQLKEAAHTGVSNGKHVEKVKIYSWMTALAVAAAVFIMTNPRF